MYSSSASSRVAIEFCLCLSGCDLASFFPSLPRQSAYWPRPDLILSFFAWPFPSLPSCCTPCWSPLLPTPFAPSTLLLHHAPTMDNIPPPPPDFALPGFAALVELTMAGQQLEHDQAILFLEQCWAQTGLGGIHPDHGDGADPAGGEAPPEHPGQGAHQQPDRDAPQEPHPTQPERACVRLRAPSDSQTIMTRSRSPSRRRGRYQCDQLDHSRPPRMRSSTITSRMLSLCTPRTFSSQPSTT